jgi:23S rRNA G2069 N7-methylase RlmK/C1962 C5-methylase RlmI
VEALAAQHGAQNVIASDVSPTNLYKAARYTTLNVLDKQALAT